MEKVQWWEKHQAYTQILSLQNIPCQGIIQTSPNHVLLWHFFCALHLFPPVPIKVTSASELSTHQNSTLQMPSQPRSLLQELALSLLQVPTSTPVVFTRFVNHG